jgi:hypothetical protein
MPRANCPWGQKLGVAPKTLMSALGQTRRFRNARRMSGLPPNSRHFRRRSAHRIWARSGRRDSIVAASGAR